MHLESKIVIRRTPEQVSSFLGDISNLPKWDRGVAAALPTSSQPPGVGFEFDTVGHSRRPDEGPRPGKMSYRLALVDPRTGHCTVELTSSSGNARFFKKAAWHFRVQPADGGTLLVCAADFQLRLRYLILAPILFAMRNAIRTDLENLKKVLEDPSQPCTISTRSANTP